MREEPGVPPEDAASASDYTSVPWPIAVMSAATTGGLLSGLVACVWGCVAFIQFSASLACAGFFKNVVIVAAFAGRSYAALTVLVLVTSAVGALAWAAAVLVYEQHSRTARKHQSHPT